MASSFEMSFSPEPSLGFGSKRYTVQGLGVLAGFGGLGFRV